MPEHMCERDLKTEGPCYGPAFPPEERGAGFRKVDGRWLCANHVVLLYGSSEYYGPKDPNLPYHISKDGFWTGPVRIGDFAKVLFAPLYENGHAEGMWVKVDRVRLGRVYGKLENRPADPEGLGVKFGDRVEFPIGAIRTVMTEAEERSIRRE